MIFKTQQCVVENSTTLNKNYPLPQLDEPGVLETINCLKPNIERGICQKGKKLNNLGKSTKSIK